MIHHVNFCHRHRCNLKKENNRIRIDRMVGRSIAAFALNFIVSSRWARDKREEGKNIRGN